MSATSRRSGGSSSNPGGVALCVLVASVLVAAGVVDTGVHLAQRIDGRRAALPVNPVALVAGLVRGSIAWPPHATAVLIFLGVLVLAVTALVGWRVLSARGRRSRVDRAARHMGTGRDLDAMSHKGASATAARLGVISSPGLPIAAQLQGGRTLYSSWEDVCVDIWGPRTGKTTSRAIPAILAAPGAVMATSNKRDLVDATRDPRAEVGQVWLFDPQGIVGEPATWWWNPLSYVVDEVKAVTLARLFAAAARQPGARTDAYFDNAGTSLLGNLLLAAAVAARPITQVYLWLTDATDDEPALILREHGYDLSAAAVLGVVSAADKQRSGVYGTAQEVVAFLTNRAAARWVTASGPGDQRLQFDPAAFVAGPHTLFSLSKEGEGSTGPLVTALTVAVTEAAEDLARRCAGGRLTTPMVVVLDEAANVCRWHALPDMYSHYGSRGIAMMTILQSWSQGVEVWGREGMRKLWSAANVKVYGGGVSEVEFLSELSQLIGDFDSREVSTSTSSSRGGGSRSTSRSVRRERVLDVADLAALPKGRAVVLASGAPATLARTLPWMAGPHAAAVTASVRAHNPAAWSTVSEAMEVLRGLQVEREHPAPNPWLAGG